MQLQLTNNHLMSNELIDNKEQFYGMSLKAKYFYILHQNTLLAMECAQRMRATSVTPRKMREDYCKRESFLLRRTQSANFTGKD